VHFVLGAVADVEVAFFEHFFGVSVVLFCAVGFVDYFFVEVYFEPSEAFFD